MGLQSYTVSYSTDGTTFTDLTNVQNITINAGRQAQLQAIQATTATVEIRYPTGFASPITALVAGTIIRIRNTNTIYPYPNAPMMFGRISNVTAIYGIPFQGGVGQSDYLTINVEGSFAALGRMQGENYVITSTDLAAQCVEASTETGLDISKDGPNTAIAPTTVSGTWGDWLAQVALTINGRLHDITLSDRITLLSPFAQNIPTTGFSDVANNINNQVYNAITFDSLSDNFYTQITVDPQDFAAVTVTKVGATAPFRTYQVNSLSASTGNATDFANYLLGNYQDASFAISSITCSAEAQNVFQLDGFENGPNFSDFMGMQVNVTFRGTVFACLVEGVTMSATPAGASFTYYFSGADLNAYLLLGNPVLGQLDNNRLGY
jgi:hypothetical protein